MEWAEDKHIKGPYRNMEKEQLLLPKITGRGIELLKTCVLTVRSLSVEGGENLPDGGNDILKAKS